ncbi:MRC1-like domain-domain-containing protein [Tuber borchii]|uniref:MRC1-like domain-domain-containing protein n=1 Tax=Tuber borchii TaxID=42251 RepID=A0A2T7A620_TUBBO|nr:MRC1-like domain-domain-containing protein [Tuber borchii]
MASLESPTAMSVVVSPPGTPSRDGSASPVLTPKSKVEAMLAEMEPTDEESGGSDGTADEDSEIELDYKPRGKLASRMMPRASDIKATKSTKTLPTIKNNTTGNGDAYERVKRSLLAGRETTSKILISDEESGNEEDKSASSSKALVQTDDDDDDLPVPTPRRKRTQKAHPKASPKANSTPSTEFPKQKGPSQSKSTTPVSASESEGGDEGDVHNLLATDPKKNARFLELVEKKRKERQAAEAEKQRLEEKRKQLDAQLGCGSETDDGEDDDDLGVLSQKPPRRRSGKKALEEMHRESQRMARNMHLEYQARTKKTITKQSLFEKFGFRAPAEKQNENKKDRVPVDSSSIITGSETEPADQSSPNSSPLPEANEKSAKIATGAMDIDNQGPSISEGPMQRESDRMGIDSTSAPKLDKGKGKARAVSEGFDEGETAHPALALDKGKGKTIEIRSSALDKGKGKASIMSSKKTKLVLPPIRVILPNKLTENASDSDSELEIVKPGDEERIANSERKKMVDQLRRVRRVKPPVEVHGKPKLSVRELEAELRKKSRQQAIQEREERIEELRAKGVIILTAEEKAKTEQQAVDYMEKARKEALAIKRREKKDGIKKEGATIDDMDPNEDDEADGDWLEEEDIVEILSGSEEEEEEEEGEEEEESAEPNDLIDEDENELMGGLGSPAFSSLYPQDNDLLSPTPRLSEMPAAYIDEEADEDSDESNGDFAPFKTLKRKAIRKKKLRVVEEDEDGENEDDAIESEEQKIAESRIPSIFRNKIAGPPPVGMTQLFNGLSGLPPSAEVSASPGKVRERLETLRQDLGEGIPNSQVPLDFGDDRLDLGFVKKKDGEDSKPIDEPSFPVLDLYYEPSTQMSSFPDPTQDDGFVKSSSPAPPRFDEDELSTIEVPDSQPPKRKRGRLVKKGADLTAVMEEDENEKESDDERKSEEVEEKKESAFDVMRKAAKKEKAAENFDKAKSGAREMVHEQAEESEDEYAGIGGASDDEAGDGHDSDVEEMIDDEGKEVVDEDDIAAFWAEQDKAQDEKDVSKLFRDLQTGLFRKKRGADFGLGDSDDDDGEARRRAKRRQMAKIRKALMADGNIEKLATNPKKLAFLNAIEDRDRDDEMDFLDKGEEDLFIDLGLLEDSQSQNPSQSHDSREASTVAGAGASRGGTPGSQHSVGESNEIPIITNTRRTTRPKKPSLADVRETLSFLIEENDSEMIELSDSDGEPAEAFMHKRRRTATTVVIDRVAASRSNSAMSESAKLAFQSATETQFRVPSLLRRATTNMSSSTSGDSQGSSGASSTTSGSGGKPMESSTTGGIKRGGKASSSINFHQREQVRAKVENERELKRKQERKRQGQERQGVLGMLTKGSFT